MGCIVCDAIGEGLFAVGHEGTELCRTCAARIARMVLEGDGAIVAEVWLVGGPIASGAPFTPPTDERDVATHVDLARAYREMGLHPDAIAEAAMGLLGPGLPSDGEAALDVLFDPSIARPGALAFLAEKLRRN